LTGLKVTAVEALLWISVYEFHFVIAIYISCLSRQKIIVRFGGGSGFFSFGNQSGLVMWRTSHHTIMAQQYGKPLEYGIDVLIL
jgi:hypothetical protein